MTNLTTGHLPLIIFLWLFMHKLIETHANIDTAGHYNDSKREQQRLAFDFAQSVH